ncbi:MAG: MBL fold metallo-hydrolase [Planctomycetota bacterium]
MFHAQPLRHITMREIGEFAVPDRAIAIWWLGQSTFVFKSPCGTIAVLDPYLTDACDNSTVDIMCKRNFPSPLEPEDLVGIDLYFVTHSHRDHLDNQTLARYRNAGGKGPYLAPADAYKKLLSLGVPKEEAVMTWPNKVHTFGDLLLRTTFAIPYASDDMTHVGYVLRVKKGPCVYVTGDTAYEEVIGTSVAEQKPDVMITVINDAFRNLGPANAARLAKQINPKVAIPCHYDLMPDNMEYPRVFRTNLLQLGMADRYRELEHAVPYVYPEE